MSMEGQGDLGGFMGDLMKKEDREIRQAKDKAEPRKIDIKEYRTKIADNSYLDHAINRIATDLSHYLTK